MKSPNIIAIIGSGHSRWQLYAISLDSRTSVPNFAYGCRATCGRLMAFVFRHVASGSLESNRIS